MSFRRACPFLAALVLAPLLGWAKAPPPSADAAKPASQAPAAETKASPPQGGWSLDLGVAHSGLSIGDSPRWNGLRFNWADQYVEYVRGVNVTLWRPEQGTNEEARYT